MAIKEYILEDIFSSKPEYGCNLPGRDKGDIKYLTQSELDCDYKKINRWLIMSSSIKKFALKKGDFLMSRAGTIKSYYHGIDEPLIFAGYLVRYNFNKSILLHKYLYYWTKSTIGLKTIDNLSKTGTTMPKLNPPIFKKIKIKLPNIEIQQEIINIIEPKEDLFLKYNKVIDISNLDNFKKSWNNLINIIEPFERLKEIFSKKSSLLNEIKDKNKIYKSFKSFKDLIYVESSKGPILKTNNYKNKYRYFNCSSNISFCNTYNKEYDFDSLIITTRGTITSHIVPKNNKFYATNNILIYKGCGINCFDIYFKRNFKKFINGTAIPMITKTDLQEIKFSYLKEAETLLSKINSLDFCTQKLVNKINYIIQLLIELFMI